MYVPYDANGVWLVGYRSGPPAAAQGKGRGGRERRSAPDAARAPDRDTLRFARRGVERTAAVRSPAVTARLAQLQTFCCSSGRPAYRPAGRGLLTRNAPPAGSPTTSAHKVVEWGPTAAAAAAAEAQSGAETECGGRGARLQSRRAAACVLTNSGGTICRPLLPRVNGPVTGRSMTALGRCRAAAGGADHRSVAILFHWGLPSWGRRLGAAHGT